MPRLPDLNPSDPALAEKIIQFAEREARELADLGIGMLADALKRRLKQSRQNGQVPAQPDHARPASPYEVLGVSPDTSIEEIERVFQKRVQVCHPDHGGDEDQLRLVVESMKVIRLERKKQ